MRAFVLIFAAASAAWSAAAAGELVGVRGSKLRGSISCVHPNLLHDLAGRIQVEQDYTYVLRIYIEQGYCIERDVPTILRQPLVAYSLPTWDGHHAELCHTTLILPHSDGTEVRVDSYSIVFPHEMESTFSH